MDKAATAQPSDGSRCVYALWAVGLGMLLVMGLFCWLLLVPFLRARSAIRSTIPLSAYQGVDARGGSSGPRSHREAVDWLGGPDAAVWPLSVYLRAPRRLAPERFLAAYLLKECSDRSVPTLARLLWDQDELVRKMAVRALSGRRGPQVLAALSVALRDESPEVRCLAVYRLTAMGDAEALELAQGALTDRDDKVRSAAAELLKKIRDGEPPK
jgi:hypothetical protein